MCSFVDIVSAAGEAEVVFDKDSSLNRSFLDNQKLYLLDIY